ncbi:MAG: SHOCT domain-containing protein [Candidatus Woesearchaeota archaeon]|nr:SHOCT domain-containing protein [Candidatus Woesearchaeota archaeon]
MEKDKNTLLWVVIAAVILLFLFSGFGMGGYGMMGFGFLFMLLFWGLIIWLIVTLINASQSKENWSDSLTILKRRYASGEITKKQYEEMKRELGR